MRAASWITALVSALSVSTVATAGPEGSYSMVGWRGITSIRAELTIRRADDGYEVTRSEGEVQRHGTGRLEDGKLVVRFRDSAGLAGVLEDLRSGKVEARYDVSEGWLSGVYSVKRPFKAAVTTHELGRRIVEVHPYVRWQEERARKVREAAEELRNQTRRTLERLLPAGEIVSPSDMREARELIEDLPKEERAELYQRVRDAAPFLNQRNNAGIIALEDTAPHGWHGGTYMCNVTALSMALGALGVEKQQVAEALAEMIVPELVSFQKDYQNVPLERRRQLGRILGDTFKHGLQHHQAKPKAYIEHFQKNSSVVFLNGLIAAHPAALQKAKLATELAKRQYEDLIDELRCLDDAGSRYKVEPLWQVARKLGIKCNGWADYKSFRAPSSNVAAKVKAHLMDKVKPRLDEGDEAMLLFRFKTYSEGHWVRIQEINEQGVVVDDPYGKICRRSYDGFRAPGYLGRNLNSWTEDTGPGEDQLLSWELLTDLLGAPGLERGVQLFRR